MLRLPVRRAGVRRGEPMIWGLIVLLVVLWLLGFSLNVAGGLIHLLLVIALIVLLFQLISGRRSV
jgi:hypothetical protein